MYRNRKNFTKATTSSTKENQNKRGLNTIDENATIKLSRNEKNNVVRELEETSSEEQIPASQEPTQRYLSQRSIASTLTRTQSRINISQQRPPNNYFELVLMKAGVQLDEGENFVLSCDHVAIVYKLRDTLLKGPNYPENVDIFKSGLCAALAPRSKLVQKLLCGCTINAPGEENVYQSQNSMLSNLLMVDVLRDAVVEVLLDKITKTACENISMRHSSDNIPLMSLLLAQLRFVTQTHGDLIYARISDIFEKASEHAKWDIIANAELVLESRKHDEFAQLLLDNMTETDIFHATTIQTLTNLWLSATMQSKLSCKILAHIKEGHCSSVTLPKLVKFLLKILHNESDDSVRELVNTLREILLRHTQTPTTAAEKQAQLDLFDSLKLGLVCSKKFFTTWQKTIAALPQTSFRSIDLLVLVLLIHIREDHYLFIENILRRRIKLEHFNVEIIDECKAKYAPFLEQQVGILMQILHDFLREKHKSVSNFARASYGILFQTGETVQKSIIKKLLELTLDRSTQNMTSLALELLKDLQRKYTRDVQNWGMLLMPLLDRLSEMSLSQTRVIMELLCSIAYPAPNLTECPVLQDQIDMLVKKQMINRIPHIRKQGIIGSVRLIDSIARIEESEMVVDDCNTTFTSISDLPDGRGKIAASLVERVDSVTMYSAENVALFYEELSSVCTSSVERANTGFLDKSFLIWLCERATLFFQNSFVAEHTPDTLFGITLTYQKCINSIEDTQTEDRNTEVPAIAINIAELVLAPPTLASSSIVVLAPLFNLCAVLHLQRYEGSLEGINALLGCAIVLPTFFDDQRAEVLFGDYDDELQKKLLDIYFYCANWIRATVSLFSTQRIPMIRSKVLQRLAELINIEERIRKLLVLAPLDYNPPICQFLTPLSGVITKKGRGKPTSNANVAPRKNNRSRRNDNNQTESEATNINETNALNITNNATLQLAVGTGKPKPVKDMKTNFVELYGPKEVYRQIGADTMLLFQEKLNINMPLPADEIGRNIGLREFRFLLTDLVSKLEAITGAHKTENEQPLQYIAKPHYFMADLSKFLRAITDNVKLVLDAICEKQRSVLYVFNHADVLTYEFSYLKVCYSLYLRLLASYFSWSEFADITKEQLLKDSLASLFELQEAQHLQLSSKCSAQIAALAFDKFIKGEKHIADLQTAVHLYHLVGCFKRFSLHESVENVTTEQQTLKLRKLCKDLLSRKWLNYSGQEEKGARCNIYLDELVRGLLSNSDFRRQERILLTVGNECKHLGTNKDSSLQSFPNFKRANFPLLFRGLCEAFTSSVTDRIASNDVNSNDKLKMWEDSCCLLDMLLDIVRAYNEPRNYTIFLKHSHYYLKMTLQRGIPICEQVLRQNPERVNGFFKTLTVITRFLHHLCCQSKAIKNTAIISQIPFLRETVESLVFRVKALLVANKCDSVFCMRNLKNKDLNGDDIVSQTTTLNDDHENSDEEIPEDDASVDETLLGQDEMAVSSYNKTSSRSKCF